MPKDQTSLLQQTDFRPVPYYGFWELYLKEVRRFTRVFTQTVAAPMVTTLLFLIVFKVALGANRPSVGGMEFAEFIAPGLIMMAVLQNAFANSSSSIMIAKVNNTLVDVLMAPLSAWELVAAMTLGALTRGLLVGLAVWLGMLLFVHAGITHLWAVLYFSVVASWLMGVAGLLTGIWSEKFDHMAAITNFIVTPLSFLSGTFYSVDRLPEGFRYLAEYNPFFYLIDGFRYGMTGYASAHLTVGVLMTLFVSVVLTVLAYVLISRGYRIKS